MSAPNNGKPPRARAKPARRLRSALQHAEALQQDLRALAEHPTQSAERWEAHLGELARLYAALTEESSGVHEDVFVPEPQQLRAFGNLLRDRRAVAGFSRASLAKLAKLSEATIKLIESAAHQPSRSTLIRLVGVDRLRLSWDEVRKHLGPVRRPLTAPAPEEAPADSRFNCYLPPEAIGRKKQDLERLLRGPGGYVPHSALYVDECSAVDYLEYVLRSPEALERRAEMPTQDLVKALAQRFARDGAAGCQLVALGPGDGFSESRLAYLLAEALQVGSFEILLIDYSPTLLQSAYAQTAALLSGRSNVQTVSALVDFSSLSLHPQLLKTGPGPRRVFTLLGGTFDELDKPLAFLQYGLPEVQPGDLLVLDVSTPAAPGDLSESICARDPWLREPLAERALKWLGGPFLRASRDVTKIELSVLLETGSPTGSYTLNVRADVSSSGARPRRFSVLRQTRHDPDRLAESLTAAGWSPLLRLPYGHTHRGCLFVCEHRPLALRDSPALAPRPGHPAELPSHSAGPLIQHSAAY